MAGYADFAFYRDTYLGKAIAEADFPRLAMRASQIIDLVTYQRALPIITANTETDVIIDIKLATCAVAEEIQKTEQRDSQGGGVIASEKQGQYAVSYVEANDAKRSVEERYRQAASLYLLSTGLMYVGFYENER